MIINDIFINDNEELQINLIDNRQYFFNNVTWRMEKDGIYLFGFFDEIEHITMN